MIKMKYILPLLLFLPFSANAGLFDDLNKGLDAINRAKSALAPAAPTEPAAAGQTGGQAASVGAADAFALTSYPRAELNKQFVNPFDRVGVPLTVPERATDGRTWLARRSAPVEGEISAWNYKHPRDDSPLLIMQHYRSTLLQQGFTVLVDCQIPCGEQRSSQNMPSKYVWRDLLDPLKRLNVNYLPDNPHWLVAWREDGMVTALVGTHVYEFTSLVHAVKGRVTDMRPIEEAIAIAQRPQTPPPATAAPTNPINPGGSAAPVATAPAQTPKRVTFIPNCMAAQPAPNTARWIVRNECGVPLTVRWCWTRGNGTSGPWVNGRNVCEYTGFHRSGVIAPMAMFEFSDRPHDPRSLESSPVRVSLVCDMSDPATVCE